MPPTGVRIILPDRIRQATLPKPPMRAPATNPAMSAEMLVQVQSRARRMQAGIPLGMQDSALVSRNRAPLESVRQNCREGFRASWATRCRLWKVERQEFTGLRTDGELYGPWLPDPGYVVKAPLRVYLGRR